MGWLLLAAVLGVLAFSSITGDGLRVDAFANEDGTWGFAGYRRADRIYQDNGPYVSEQAAEVAGAVWLVTERAKGGIKIPGVVELPDPPPGQQGGGAPPVPYLVVTSQGIQGGAQVEGDRVRWTAGAETDTAGNAMTANATLLARIDANAPSNAPVNISLRKASGSTLQARVSRQVGQPAQVWVWSISNPPAVAGGVGSSTTEQTWRANNRLGAMRGALSTLQDA